jgi:uncharacterized protein (TIGR02996 family)
MTANEEAIQKQLDENPAWSDGRLVLADHLDDIGDPRAEGYRKLGAERLAPIRAMEQVSQGVWRECWFGHVADHPEPFPTRRAADDAAAEKFSERHDFTLVVDSVAGQRGTASVVVELA